MRLHSALLCTLLSALPASAGAQSRPSETAVRGTVLDEQSGPVATALVEFLDNRDRVQGRATTANDGSFVISRVPVGPFRLRATRIGFVRTVTPYWRIRANETLTVNVRMSATAVVHAPLEITARANSASPVLSGFYDRAERKLGGVFIRRAEIEARDPVLISDLLNTVPGIEITTARGLPSGARIVRFSRTLPGPRGGPCPVQVFVDGVLATRAGEVVIDELATPGALEGIEIHRGTSSLPAEFVTPNARCGVIALWTRRGG